MWHIQDSQSQILALDLGQQSLKHYQRWWPYVQRSGCGSRKGAVGGWCGLRVRIGWWSRFRVSGFWLIPSSATRQTKTRNCWDATPYTVTPVILRGVVPASGDTSPCRMTIVTLHSESFARASGLASRVSVRISGFCLRMYRAVLREAHRLLQGFERQLHVPEPSERCR